MIHLCYPGTSIELRRVPADFYSVGGERVIDLELVANEDHSECRLACTQAGWLQVSSDGGAFYNPIGTNVLTGVNIGALAAGSRTPIKLKVAIPGGTVVRQRSVGLLIGLGIDAVPPIEYLLSVVHPDTTPAEPALGDLVVGS